MPAPSMMPPAAITGKPRLRTSNRVRAMVPIQSSAASGSNTPRWPPASKPWAMTGSIPAAPIEMPLRIGGRLGEQHDAGLS